MVRSGCLLAWCLALTFGLLAQGQKGPAQKTGQPKSEAESAARPQGLTLDGVVSMVQAGLSEDVIIARIRKEDKPFDLSPEDMIKLKKAGASDGILKVMLDPKAEPKVPTPPPQPVSAAPAQVVVANPVVPGMIAPSNPSGATVAPGAAVPVGDPNDPMTPHDSGVYLYTKDRDGNPKIMVLERAAYQGSKTGGMFGAVMTGGLMKAKMKAVIAGARASIRTGDARPEFYFYFEDKAAGLGKSYFGSANLSNPNQFALIKLEVKKSNRETIIGEFGAFGASSGTHAKSMIPFKSERLRAGLYKVVPTQGLEEGEYCFLASAGQMGAYGAGAAGAVEIFDFAVVPNQ